jgi:ketosteroid isomerase-like protein
MTAALVERVQRLEDLHALQQLRARYCQYLDDGRWEELAELFTADGAFVGLSTARGREQLRTFFAGLQEGSLTSWWHFSSNETLELDGDTATGDTWLLQPCVVDGQAQMAAGRYTDRMLRAADGGWLFQERKVRFFWWVDLDQGWDGGRFTWDPAKAAADELYPAR